MCVQVRGTRDMMSRPNGPLDGFNMESFYGFIEVGHKCANWPVGTLPTAAALLQPRPLSTLCLPRAPVPFAVRSIIR